MTEVGKFYLVKNDRHYLNGYVIATNPQKRLSLILTTSWGEERRMWVSDDLLEEVPEMLVESIKAEFAKLPQILPPRS